MSMHRTTFGLPISTPKQTFSMIGNQGCIETLLNDLVRKAAYRLLTTPDLHLLLNSIPFRLLTPAGCENNIELYLAKRWY